MAQQLDLTPVSDVSEIQPTSTKLDLTPVESTPTKLDLTPISESTEPTVSTTSIAPKLSSGVSPKLTDVISSVSTTSTPSKAPGYVGELGAAASYLMKSAPSQQKYSSIDEEISKRPILSRPAIIPENVTDSELNSIASQFKVPVSKLRDFLPLVGYPQGKMSAGDIVERVGGVAGEMAASLPQKLYKVLHGVSDPNLEKALDKVQELAEARRPLAESAAQLLPVGGGAAVAGKGLGLLSKVLTGAAVGAGWAVGESRRGEEVSAAKSGAKLGAKLGVVGAAAGKVFSRKAPVVAPSGSMGVKNTTDIQAGASAVKSTRAPAEQLVRDYSLGLKPISELTDTEAEKIVTTHIRPEDVADIATRDQMKSEAIRVINDRTKLVGKVMSGRTAGESLARTPEGVREQIAEAATRQGGEDYLAHISNLASDEDAALTHLDRSGVAAAGRRGDFGTQAVNISQSPNYVMRDMDERLGTSAELAHEKLNSAVNLRDQAIRNRSADIGAIDKLTDKLGADRDLVYKAMREADRGNTELLDSLPDAEKEIADRWRQHFDSGRELVNSTPEGHPEITPLSIEKREHYLSEKLRPAQVIQYDISKLADKVMTQAETIHGGPLSDLSQLSGREYSQLLTTSPELDQLQQGLRRLGSNELDRASDMSKAIKEVTSGQSGLNRIRETVASAAESRDTQTPDWMLETNLNKIADNWNRDTLNHYYLRQPVDQLRSQSRILESAGALTEARYIDRLLSDTLSGAGGSSSLAKWSRWSEGDLAARTAKLQDRIDETTNPVVRGALKTWQAMPYVIKDLSGVPYTNAVGLSPKIWVLHAIQPLTRTAPELGNVYGTNTVLRGAVDVIRRPGELLQKAKDLGLLSTSIDNPAYVTAMREGIRRSIGYKVPVDTINTINHVALKINEGLFTAARLVVVSTAEHMADDLAKGLPEARQALNKLPTILQRAVTDNLKEGNVEEVSNILARHLNATTALNFNTASASELARTLGSKISMFSKYRDAFVGDVAANVRTKSTTGAATELLAKYGGYYTLFQLADHLYHNNWESFNVPTSERSEREKIIFGSAGPAALTPVHAIMHGPVSSPYVTIPYQLVNDILSKDDRQARKGWSNAVNIFTPGSFIYRFLTQTAPTMITGDRPPRRD